MYLIIDAQLSVIKWVFIYTIVFISIKNEKMKNKMVFRVVNLLNYSDFHPKQDQ